RSAENSYVAMDTPLTPHPSVPDVPRRAAQPTLQARAANAPGTRPRNIDHGWVGVRRRSPSLAGAPGHDATQLVLIRWLAEPLVPRQAVHEHVVDDSFILDRLDERDLVLVDAV